MFRHIHIAIQLSQKNRIGRCVSPEHDEGERGKIPVGRLQCSGDKSSHCLVVESSLTKSMGHVVGESTIVHVEVKAAHSHAPIRTQNELGNERA